MEAKADVGMHVCRDSVAAVGVSRAASWLTKGQLRGEPRQEVGRIDGVQRTELRGCPLHNLLGAKINNIGQFGYVALCF